MFHHISCKVWVCLNIFLEHAISASFVRQDPGIAGVICVWIGVYISLQVFRFFQACESVSNSACPQVVPTIRQKVTEFRAQAYSAWLNIFKYYYWIFFGIFVHTGFRIAMNFQGSKAFGFCRMSSFPLHWKSIMSLCDVFEVETSQLAQALQEGEPGAACFRFQASAASFIDHASWTPSREASCQSQRSWNLFFSMDLTPTRTDLEYSMLVCQKSSAAQLFTVHAVPFEGSVESGAQKLCTKVAASCNDPEMTTSSQVARGSLQIWKQTFGGLAEVRSFYHPVWQRLLLRLCIRAVLVSSKQHSLKPLSKPMLSQFSTVSRPISGKQHLHLGMLSSVNASVYFHKAGRRCLCRLRLFTAGPAGKAVPFVSVDSDNINIW